MSVSKDALVIYSVGEDQSDDGGSEANDITAPVYVQKGRGP